MTSDVAAHVAHFWACSVVDSFNVSKGKSSDTHGSVAHEVAVKSRNNIQNIFLIFFIFEKS